MDLSAYLKIAIDFAYPGLMAAFGATAKYIHMIVTKKATFLWLFFFGNLFVAFFVGVLVNDFLDPGYRSRDGIFMLCGVAAIKLFSMGEKGFEAVAQSVVNGISTKLGKPTNPAKEDNKDEHN